MIVILSILEETIEEKFYEIIIIQIGLIIGLSLLLLSLL